MDSLLHHKIYKNKHKNADWIILLHGFGGNSTIWYKQLVFYRKYFNVMTIDLPGHFPNDKLKDWDSAYSFKNCAMMIHEVMNFNKIDKAHFVGMSLGSVIIHEFIKGYAHKVISVVLGGCITRYNFLATTLLKLGYFARPILTYMTLYRIFAWLMMPKANHKNSRALFVKEAIRMGRAEFLKWFDLARDVKSTFEGIGHIKIPKLYVSGKEDHFFFDLVKKDVKNDPYAKFCGIDGSGHVCNVEKSNEFNQISLKFLMEQDDMLQNA